MWYTGREGSLIIRRVRSILFTLAAAISLVLCVGSPVACVRSYRRPAMIYYDWLETRGPVEVRSVYAESVNGMTKITADRTIADSPGRAAKWLAEPRPRGFQRYGYGGVRLPVRPWAGFRFRSIREQNKRLELTVVVHTIGVPYWFWTLVCAVPPLAWVARWRRERRRAGWLRAGCCPRCGYDLRATPERCPECGCVPAEVRKETEFAA